MPSATSSTQPSSSNNSHRTPVGAIAGGIVGGVALLALLGVLIFLARKRRKSREPKHPPYVEVSGESKGQQGQNLHEMYQMPEELEGNLQQNRLVGQSRRAELSGDGTHSPVELSGDRDVSELNGSVR